MYQHNPLCHYGGMAPSTPICVTRSQSEEATGALVKINLGNQCMWVSAKICSLNVYCLMGFLRP